MNELPDPIAIIGLAGRFPGARSADEFWRNLMAGSDSVELLDDDALRANGVPEDALSDPDYVKAVAQAPDLDRFDAGLFGFTPRDAEISDPQIRLFLETAHAALENAGHVPGSLPDVGVFGSVGTNTYQGRLADTDGGRARSTTGMSRGALNNADSAATLVSYKLGLHGPSMTVQTACSSSLVAVHLAAQSLRAGECELALAGGADVELPLGHGHYWAEGGPLTKDGRCRPFDAEASGTVFGSGAGVVVLRRLSDALADGDRVLAVLRSTAVNNDGAEKVGYTAPSVTGQVAVVAEAISMAGIDAGDISLVESHGTGTVLGDPIEVAALNKAFRMFSDELEPGSCALTSVKGNVGHLGHAAGVTSLIKVVLSLVNERIPGNVNLDRPNPKLELDGSPFQLPVEAKDWPSTPGKPRFAGVSSLGIGGTNVHAVLEEAPPRLLPRHDDSPRLVVWSARTPQAADTYRERLAGHFAAVGEGAFAAGVDTLQRGRTAHPVRGATVAAGAAEAVAVLTDPRSAAIVGTSRDRPGGITFLFPGQGSQHAGMAHDLYDHEPAFAAPFDEVLNCFHAEDLPLRQWWRKAARDGDLQSTLKAQPLLFAVEYALARMWMSCGVRPTALLGHSIGEVTAAAVAEVLSLPDAVRAVAVRARAMEAQPPGAMLAVAASADRVRPLMTDGVTIAVVNGPEQVVVAGGTEDLNAFAAAAREAGLVSRRINTSHAFHSPGMAGAADAYHRAVAGMELRPPSIPVYSAATGALMTDAQATDPAFWSGQLTAPVHFGAALDTLLAEQDRLLLEVGPGRTLTALVRRHPAVQDGGHVLAATLPHRRMQSPGDRRSVLNALAAVWTDGHDVAWDAVSGGAPWLRTEVPGYPYQRERYWAEPSVDRPSATGPAAITSATAALPAGPAEPQAVSPFSIARWTEEPPPAARPEPARGPREAIHAVALLPADRTASVNLLARLSQAGLRIVPVWAGEGFGEVAGGFTVRPAHAEDLRSLLDTLADRQTVPELIVHGWMLGAADSAADVEQTLELGFHTVTELVRQAGRALGGSAQPALMVVTERSVDVSGDEPVEAAHAMLTGLVRTLAKENPRAAARLIDLGTGVGEDETVQELRRWRDSGLIALRGDRRWLPVETGYRPDPLEANPLRRGGVYLITGGLGGLGLSVAKGLARSGLRPRLVLLGRGGVLAQADREELEHFGAVVRARSCDVTDTAALTTVVDEVTAEHGPVHGVFHLAGIAGDAMVQFSDRARAQRTLAPKVAGALALCEVFEARRTLDFFVGFSSRAALDGLVGSGDYAAGNAFLDAWIRSARINADRLLSINWPSWTDVGMAVGGLADDERRRLAEKGGFHWSVDVSAEAFPVLDEHRMDGTPVMPGTAYLDLAIGAYRSDVLGVAEGSVRVSDAVFRRPLAVPAARRLEIAFVPDPVGGHTFTITSTPVGGPGTVLTHVTGWIGSATAERRRVDLEALLASVPDSSPSALKSGRLAFALGPRWHTVEEVRTTSADRELRVVALALPEEFAAEAGQHAVHPTLLDAATAYARDIEREDPHLPFLYRELTVHEALPPKLFSKVRRKDSARDTIAADIELIAPDGRVVAEITGFMMRRITGDVLGGADTAGAAAPAGLRPEGIPPRTGLDLLFELLGGHTPRQVAVRPFRQEEPLPLGDAIAEPVAEQVAAATANGGETPAPAPDSGLAVAPSATTTAARTASVDDRVAAVWSAMLGIGNVALDDDFFELGGNSLTAVELMSHLRAEFGIDLSIAAMFDFPTPRTLAKELRRLGAI
ncbi:type I polyketide synthase [Streptomyces sp. NPDC005811]|uniref:type I polyketide synthase n=1 Tax=Streptomyces sp. NPDC005811 TaxID=3154565 RepID=UPI0033DFE7E8